MSVEFCVFRLEIGVFSIFFSFSWFLKNRASSTLFSFVSFDKTRFFIVIHQIEHGLE